MKYRSDIDGLRAISVVAVILFHVDLNFISGGFVGVDIFFVISGYLITGLIYDEINSGIFTFSNFYKRRIARLLPALNITLLIVLIFGFFFYDNKAFDNLGKEIFFSAIGGANILFGQGVNYFAQEESVRPLIHLWSLGVEEQFYLVWPSILILLVLLRKKYIIWPVLTLFAGSLTLSILFVTIDPIKTYFHPQYRAFELITGALTALLMRTHAFERHTIINKYNEIISIFSMSLITLPMFILDKNSTFPGINALFPCVGTALFIVFSKDTITSRLLSIKPIVLLGLISYPLYLYHQPIISFLLFFGLKISKPINIFIIIISSITLSWLTYIHIETPIRNNIRIKKSSLAYVLPLTLILSSFAAIGLFFARSNGFGLRFQMLNPFAYQVTQHNTTTFHKHFERGLKISNNTKGKILFIGDSVLQQYVYPFTKALRIKKEEVDTATRGGCVLIKNVDFIDKFSDISCNNLRNELYKQTKQYEYIIISQDWDGYDDKILNFHSDTPYKKWEPFINDTIEHFSKLSNNIVIIGSHLKIDGTSKLKPTIFLSKNNYINNLKNLKVYNYDELKLSRSFFEQWQTHNDVTVIHPLDIWYDGTFTLHNGKWSFFSDSRHVSKMSTEHVVERLLDISQLKYLM